jgi:hypothetical protein
LYAGLSVTLGEPVVSADALRLWLRSHPHTLFVLDNVDAVLVPVLALAQSITAASPSAAVIVTARSLVPPLGTSRSTQRRTAAALRDSTVPRRSVVTVAAEVTREEVARLFTVFAPRALALSVACLGGDEFNWSFGSKSLDRTPMQEVCVWRRRCCCGMV